MASGYEKSPDYGSPRMSWLRVFVTAAVVAAFVGVAFWVYPVWADQLKLAMCSGKVRVSCVVDGDTFWLNGEKIRIADIDTPEISTARCPQELMLAAKATVRLIDLLNQNQWE